MSKADGDEIVIIRGHRHVVCDCGTCGTVYTVNEVRYDYMRRAGGYAHCPNGHQWGWSEGTKQRDELRLERDRLRQEQARLIDERNEALRMQAPPKASWRSRPSERSTAFVHVATERSHSSHVT